MFVKICGILRPEDAVLAEAAGADAIGVNLYPGSKRFVADPVLRQEIRQAAGKLLTVAVMVDPTPEEVAGALATFDCIQFHGREPAKEVAALGERGFKALAASEAALATLGSYGGRFVLLDTPSPGHGGSGQTFDWTLAKRAAAAHRIVLAGGLTPDNVARAIEAASPYGVDVASGVEIAAGAAPLAKDPDKVRRFVASARAAARPGRAEDPLAKNR